MLRGEQLLPHGAHRFHLTRWPVLASPAQPGEPLAFPGASNCIRSVEPRERGLRERAAADEQVCDASMNGVGDTAGWANVLAGVPLFAGLGRRHLRRVASAGRIGRFHNATAIIRSGESGDTFYVVLDGEVTVRRRGLPELSLGMGSYFGEMALLDGGVRTATVMAKGPVTCLAITRSRFLKLLRSEPAIAAAILEELARRLRTMQASM